LASTAITILLNQAEIEAERTPERVQIALAAALTLSLSSFTKVSSPVSTPPPGQK
jgi:hypothetical protein